MDGVEAGGGGGGGGIGGWMHVHQNKITGSQDGGKGLTRKTTLKLFQLLQLGSHLLLLFIVLLLLTLDLTELHRIIYLNCLSSFVNLYIIFISAQHV